jgi:hypothetical protein
MTNFSRKGKDYFLRRKFSCENSIFFAKPLPSRRTFFLHTRSMKIVLTFDSQSACGYVRGYRNKNISRSYFEIIKNRHLQIKIFECDEVSFF